MTHALIVKRNTGIQSGSGTGITLPALFHPDAATAKRVLEFCTANIRNPNTRKAYAKAAGDFAIWCEAKSLEHLRDVQPIHVAANLRNPRCLAPCVVLYYAITRLTPPPKDNPQTH